MSTFYHRRVWGVDRGALQLRADWDAPPRFLWHSDASGIWFLFLGPFEVSGHVWRRFA